MHCVLVVIAPPGRDPDPCLSAFCPSSKSLTASSLNSLLNCSRLCSGSAYHCSFPFDTSGSHCLLSNVSGKLGLAHPKIFSSCPLPPTGKRQEPLPGTLSLNNLIGQLGLLSLSHKQFLRANS